MIAPMLVALVFTVGQPADPGVVPVPVHKIAWEGRHVVAELKRLPDPPVIAVTLGKAPAPVKSMVVRFEQGSWEVCSVVEEALARYAGKSVRITGMASPEGEDGFNRQLARRRADEVARIIEDAGGTVVSVEIDLDCVEDPADYGECRVGHVEPE